MENTSNFPDSGKKTSQQQIIDLVAAAFLLAIIAVMATTPLGFIRLGVTALTVIHIPVIIGSIILGPRYGAFLGFAFGMSSFLNATFAPDATSFAFSPFYSVGEFQGNGWSLVIAFVPRILTGIVPFFAFTALNKIIKMRHAELISHLFIITAFAALVAYKFIEMSGDDSTSILFDFLIYVSILIYIIGDSISKKFKFRNKETMPFVASGVIGSLTNTVLVLGFMYLFFGQDVANLVGTSVDVLYKFIFTIIAFNGIPEAILASMLTVLICKAVFKQRRKGME